MISRGPAASSRKIFRHSYLALALCLASALVGCHNWKPLESSEPMTSKHSPMFVKALSDFVFVGSVQNHSQTVPTHSMEVKSLPKTLQAGQKYIFHRRAPTNNDELFKELQERLRSNGVTILEAKGGGTRYIGGLVFHISFKEGEYRGIIYNTLDGQIVNNENLNKNWAFDDYLLVLEEADS